MPPPVPSFSSPFTGLLGNFVLSVNISGFRDWGKIMAACRLPAAAVLAFGSIYLGGCLPDHPVWLPDSSGFLYTAGTDRTKIVRYDVGQRSSRVIANLPSQRDRRGGRFLWPEARRHSCAKHQHDELPISHRRVDPA